LLAVLLQAEPLKVLVTGAAGQIAYSLLYSVAKGDVFGINQVCFLVRLEMLVFTEDVTFYRRCFFSF